MGRGHSCVVVVSRCLSSGLLLILFENWLIRKTALGAADYVIYLGPTTERGLYGVSRRSISPESSLTSRAPTASST
jgi:hypothetical protein